MTGPRLDGWKSISSFLGKSLRTVQRWHSDFGLPVHQIHGDRGGVFAFVDQLNAWLAASYSNEDHRAPDLNRPLHGVPDGLCGVNPDSKVAEMIDAGYSMWEVLSYKKLPALARLFRGAGELDPMNPLAWAGLGHLLILQGLWGYISLGEAYRSAAAAVDHSLHLDGSCEEALSALAILKIVAARDWDGARNLVEVLSTSEVRSPRVLMARALLHLAEGKLDKSAQGFRALAEKHPLNQTWEGLLCWVDIFRGRKEEAASRIARVRRAGGTGREFLVPEAITVLHANDPDRAADRIQVLLKEDPECPLLQGSLGYIEALCGRREKAREILEVLAQGHPISGHKSHYGIAMVQTGLEEYENAVRSLRLAYTEGSLASLAFHCDPLLRPLSDLADFRQFVRESYPLGVHAGQAYPAAWIPDRAAN